MNCLIVDDDPLICDLLEHFCSKIEAIQGVTVTNNGFESVNLINQNHFDLILLDFDLPDITGKDILELLPKDTVVIMITANKEFALDSYEYEQVADFLAKPIDFTRFFKGVQKVLKKEKDTPVKSEKLFIKDGTSLVKVDLAEVLFVKSAANYVELVLVDRKIMTLMTLKEIEQKLPDRFQRIHRSYIVNVDKIDSISGGDVHIREEEISISESYEKDLLKKINLLS